MANQLCTTGCPKGPHDHLAPPAPWEPACAPGCRCDALEARVTQLEGWIRTRIAPIKCRCWVLNFADSVLGDKYGPTPEKCTACEAKALLEALP